MARTDNTFTEKDGSYIKTIWSQGRNWLINGANKYLNFNSISGETGYGIRDNGGTLQAKNSGGSWANLGVGGGQANTASNLGLGEGVFKQKTGVDLEFKTLIGGSGITLSSDGNEVTVDADGGGTTVDHVSNVATDTILGRITASSGNSEELTPAQVRTLINVADGATPDQDLSGKQNILDEGAFVNGDKTKLDTYSEANQTTNNAKISFNSTASTKVGHITVTQAVNLDTMESDIAALEQAVVLKGLWDASAGTFPGGGTAQAGFSYIVSVGGTVNGIEFNANDRLVAILDNASTTTYASNWHKLDYTDAVLSVAGRTGAVTLVKGDVDLGSVDNTADTAKPVSTAQQTALNLKANLASPALTGTPTAPTQTAGNNSTRIATTAFATTALNLKANLASPTFTGTPTLPTGTIATTQSAGNNTTAIATTAFATTALNLKANIRGAVNAQTGTTYTLVIGDEYLDGVRQTNAAANTVTIPPNSAVAFPVNTKILITQGGAGSTTIAAGAGVTLNAPASAPLAIGEIHGSRVCQKTATDTWLII